MALFAENKWGIGLMLIGAGLAVFVGKVLGTVCVIIGLALLLIPSRKKTGSATETLSIGDKRTKIDSLDGFQKQFLRLMVETNRRTAQVDSNNALIQSLVIADFLRFTSQRVPVYRAPVMITDWAWDYLREHRELLR
jgi:hypothetical protein